MAEEKKAVAAVSKAISKAKRIVFVTGAGISTSCGIPDFRGKHGLYTATESGSSIFSAACYQSREGVSDHIRAMTSLHASTSAVQPSPTHRFIKTIADKGSLLRAYTQNIDGLEAKAGLSYVDLASDPSQSTSSKKRKRVQYVEPVVQLHGNVHTVRCSLCAYSIAWTPTHSTIFDQGLLDNCPDCDEEAATRARLNKRRIVKPSFVRPNVVLYDESHPHESTIGDIIESDLRARPDVLIVAGTALKVNGARILVKNMAKAVRANKGMTVRIDMLPGSVEWSSNFDHHLTGACDNVVDAIVKEWKKTRPQDWQSQPSLASVLQSTKPAVAAASNAKPTFRGPFTPAVPSASVKK